MKIFRDRTEQRRAEARVRESEERFRLFVANIPQLDALRKRGAAMRLIAS